MLGKIISDAQASGVLDPPALCPPPPDSFAPDAARLRESVLPDVTDEVAARALTTWAVGLLLAAVAWMVWVRRGSATPLHILPKWSWGTIKFWAAIAYATSVTAFLRLAPVGTAIPQLGRDYYTIMGIGLLAAFGVITLTLHLLRRMTAPSTVRFE